MSPEDQLRAAAEVLRRGDAAQGFSIIQAAVTASGGRKDVYIHATRILVDVGHIVGALSLLEQALPKFSSSGALLDCFEKAVARANGDPKARAMVSDIVAKLPADAEQLANVGRALLGHGELKTALTALERSRELEGDNPRTLAALGACLFRLDRREDAVSALKQALALAPDNAEIRHMHASFSGADVTAAPLAYVENLFDAYADWFDKDLVGKLKYQTPQDTLTILKTVRPDAGAFNSFLDIGCGTGLVAEALKSHYRISHSVGVDLSRKMIDVAAAKNVYQELLCGDAIELLRGMDGTFDLVAAVEIAVYLGDLRALTDVVADRLRPGGLYVYSIETMQGETYKLQPTQRFAHSVAYVIEVAASRGLKLLAGTETMLRLDAGKPLPGYVGILVKEQS
jgi:predicted TPR repeat methyltransferase